MQVEAPELLDVAVPGGAVTEAGVRNNVAVSLRYLESWLRGTGAVAVFNLMEDVATAEIARAQIWQWCHHRVAARRRGYREPGAGASASKPRKWRY